MADGIALENGRISNFKGLVTLTLDRLVLHTVVHHSSTSTYMPNFIETKNFLWTDGHTYACTYVHTHVHTDGRTDERTYGRMDI